MITIYTGIPHVTYILEKGRVGEQSISTCPWYAGKRGVDRDEQGKMVVLVGQRQGQLLHSLQSQNVGNRTAKTTILGTGTFRKTWHVDCMCLRECIFTSNFKF